MDSFFCHGEIPSKQLLALCFGQGWAGLAHPFPVETSKAAIASGPISGMTYIQLSTLRPALAEFDNGDPRVVGSSVPGVVFEDGRVEVCHGSRKLHSGIIEKQK